METPRLTLSCTICHTRKSCLGDRKKCFRVTFAASFRVILSNLDCKTVKVTLQNSQSETARLTWWRANIDYLGTVLHGFLQEEEAERCRKFAYPAEYQEYTKSRSKHRKTGVKLAIGCRRGFDGRISMSRKYHTRLCPGSGWYYFIIVAEFFWSLQPGFSSCWYSRCRTSDADNGV